MRHTLKHLHNCYGGIDGYMKVTLLGPMAVHVQQGSPPVVCMHSFTRSTIRMCHRPYVTYCSDKILNAYDLDESENCLPRTGPRI